MSRYFRFVGHSSKAQEFTRLFKSGSRAGVTSRSKTSDPHLKRPSFVRLARHQGFDRNSDLLNSSDLLYAVRHRLQAQSLQILGAAVIRCYGIRIYNATGATRRSGDESGREPEDRDQTMGAPVNARW